MRAITKDVKVARLGKSLGFQIPREIVDQLGSKEGELLKVNVTGDKVTFCRAKPRTKWTERELLRGVTRSMCGPELIP